MTTASDWVSYLDSGQHWNVRAGGTLSFSFYETGSLLYGEAASGISELPDDVKDSIRSILSATQRFIGIRFEEVQADSSATYGQLRFMNDTAVAYGVTYLPSGSADEGGDVHLNPSYNGTSTNGWASAPADHGYQAIWHEIGHALGLDHPFGPPVEAPAEVDNFNFTTMTYNFTGEKPTSWMPGDIYVLQGIYGANTAWANGDTTYTFGQTDSFSDGVIHYGSATRAALAVIWDGGGIDTLDLSAVSSAGLTIDLTPGTGVIANTSSYNATSYTDHWGTVDTGTFFLTSSGTFIAFDVTIENAVGCAAPDLIIGNDAPNSLKGGGGNDKLQGRAGQDKLVGGSGDDRLDGGAGADTLSGGSGSDTYIVDHAGDIITELAGNGSDLVKSSLSCTLGVNFEKLTLTGTETVNGTGNGLDNTLSGNTANNVLKGFGGNDILGGYAGDDKLLGGLGNDSLTGGLGKDVFRFDTAANTLTNKDTIAAFSVVDDTLQLENAVFTKVGLAGTLAATAFWKSATAVAAHDATDRVIYNTTTGALYYDADGAGTRSAPVWFATLAGSPDGLTNADFVVT